DLVARAGEPIAARRRHLLDEDKHRDVLLARELADTAEDQRRLHRRATRRTNRQRHGPPTLRLKPALELGRHAAQTQAAAERPDLADDAGEAHDADDGGGGE